MATKKSVGDLKEADLKGKKVFARVDLNFLGFDANELTSRSRGKATAVQQIRKVKGYKELDMIGDGATDLESENGGHPVAGFSSSASGMRGNNMNRVECIMCFEFPL
ncbi:hypothetical protein GOBAR_AA36091 [Gossypium barbadense]|uniref:Phosphoglycerate kinase n=1 Tax=Gossypium barbadense TaxID=3634 RepID=A0A2P5W0J9_GOSBA|nr:hypothetical protein GOBAR_AA36091 [Gossypium barbadense]